MSLFHSFPHSFSKHRSLAHSGSCPSSFPNLNLKLWVIQQAEATKQETLFDAKMHGCPAPCREYVLNKHLRNQMCILILKRWVLGSECLGSVRLESRTEIQKEGFQRRGCGSHRVAPASQAPSTPLAEEAEVESRQPGPTSTPSSLLCSLFRPFLSHSPCRPLMGSQPWGWQAGESTLIPSTLPLQPGFPSPRLQAC